MSAPKNKIIGLLISAVGLLVLAALAAWFWPRRTEPKLLPSTPVASAPRIASLSPVVSRAPEAAQRKWQDLYSSLNTAPDATTSRRHLAELQAALRAQPTNVSVADIRQFLDAKMDTPTHLGFKVGRTGQLDEAPTLRTVLLDELARLDPAAAADYAKVILTSKDSPDEWALALRNLARGDPSAAGHALLEEKTREMLQYASWQQAPTVGFLESFDVAVHLGGTSLLPVLSEMVRRQDNPAVAHASFLALDRLVINDAGSTLAALRAAPELMEGRELTRANYFARGDVRDPQQRQILESYLSDPQIGLVELEAFAGVFPNANFMISVNLLTQNQTPDHAALVGRDVESLRVVQQWLGDPRFAPQRPALEKMARRLQEFVRQASQKQ
jgi:hypothetical protein